MHLRTMKAQNNSKLTKTCSALNAAFVVIAGKTSFKMNRVLLSLVALFLFTASSYAQKSSIAVVGMDVQDATLKNQNITELVRIQLTKYERYQVIDRYEIAEKLKQSNIDAATCLSLSCLKKAGEAMQVDKVISGSVDRMGEALYIRLRLVDIKSGEIDNEAVKEFLYLPEYINSMITMTFNILFDLPSDKLLEKSLSSKNNYENAVNNPNYNVLELSGPRMGYTFFTGTAAETLRKPRSEGGYNAFPAMFQFGYQFEKQYLSEGKFQALFEFIPLILGLDQQMFVPSFTFMNGLRNNENGFEFAIGPNFSFLKEAEYFQEANGEWVYARSVQFIPDGTQLEYKMDSRGDIRLRSSIVIGVGMSLRSGRMNIPINAFASPGKGGFRYGFSFGFNARG